MEEKYLEALIAQIREKRAREQVYHEVKGHLDDQKAAYVADGMTDEEAEEKAVADMGDPLEAGTALICSTGQSPRGGCLRPLRRCAQPGCCCSMRFAKTWRETVIISGTSAGTRRSAWPF